MDKASALEWFDLQKRHPAQLFGDCAEPHEYLAVVRDMQSALKHVERELVAAIRSSGDYNWVWPAFVQVLTELLKEAGEEGMRWRELRLQILRRMPEVHEAMLEPWVDHLVASGYIVLVNVPGPGSSPGRPRQRFWLAEMAPELEPEPEQVPASQSGSEVALARRARRAKSSFRERLEQLRAETMVHDSNSET